MKKIIVAILAFLALFIGVYAQQHTSIAGTWNMTLQSHQLALALM